MVLVAIQSDLVIQRAVRDEGSCYYIQQPKRPALELIIKTIKSNSHARKDDISIYIASKNFYKEDTKKHNLDFKNLDSDLYRLPINGY